MNTKLWSYRYNTTSTQKQTSILLFQYLLSHILRFIKLCTHSSSPIYIKKKVRQEEKKREEKKVEIKERQRCKSKHNKHPDRKLHIRNILIWGWKMTWYCYRLIQPSVEVGSLNLSTGRLFDEPNEQEKKLQLLPTAPSYGPTVYRQGPPWVQQVIISKKCEGTHRIKGEFKSPFKIKVTSHKIKLLHKRGLAADLFV